MRKHHTRWVALFSAAAISTTGLVGLAGPAAADDKDTRAFSWPVVRQGVSTYSVDGYDIAYLPAGLERYGINASSTTDRQGNSQSQLSWVQGPDQLYGRVAVLRSERIQDLEDLREGRYSHLADSSLEELEAGEAFEHGAYLSEETGDLFWVQRPGVAIATHLQPERWEGRELLKLAEAITEEAGAEEAETEEAETEEEAGTEDAEAETPTDETPTDEAPVDEVPAEEAPAEEAPTDEAPVGEAPVEEVVDEDGAEKPADPVQEAPVDEVPADEDATDETPVDEAPAEEDATDEAPIDETPEEEVPAEEDATDEAPVDEEVVDGDEVGGITPVEDLEEVVPPVEADLPDGISSREVKTCLTEHFVDFRSGQTDLDSAQMTQASGKFIEKALSKDDLDDAERDRLLATVWYYGDESDKAAATDDCARQFDIERSEVEDALAEISHLIGQIIQEANESLSQAMDEVEKATGEAGQVTDPVDAEEWAELWESLPWTLPAETS